MTDPVLVDGTTQPGYKGIPLVRIDGSLSGACQTGLSITAGSSTVRGLALTGWCTGISLNGGGDNRVERNDIGTDGGRLLPNLLGVSITGGSSNNTVGGTTRGAGNVISGNPVAVQVDGPRTVGNAILGNSISLDAHGIVLSSGGNANEPAPVIAGVTTKARRTTITGTVGSGGRRIEVFSNVGCPDGGRDFVGSVSTANGTWTLTVSPLGADRGVTATATNLATSNTSPFSACRLVALGKQFGPANAVASPLLSAAPARVAVAPSTPTARRLAVRPVASSTRLKRSSDTWLPLSALVSFVLVAVPWRRRRRAGG